MRDRQTADPPVIGQSPRMREILDFVKVIATSESSVLITGESGTGKEVVARLIHQSSPRRAGPFVAVSCAILTESLIESELFGHERGAFTNAFRERPGRFELAEGGTLFLDDMDDVPLSMQVKLLRVLQTRTIERVGGARPMPIDVRVLTGTKRDLRKLVSAGTFRGDLFYRLNVIPINLPPLRDRAVDIPLLVDHFLTRYFKARGRAAAPLSPAMLAALTRYPWPGNVRELENVCERIAQTCICDTVRAGCIPASVLLHKDVTGAEPESLAAAPDGAAADTASLDDRLRRLETHLIMAALREARGNRSRAAARLRIKRSTLGDRIRKLGLDGVDFDADRS